jgi:hypothetical protein
VWMHTLLLVFDLDLVCGGTRSSGCRHTPREREREDIKVLVARSPKRGGRVGGSAAPTSGGSGEGEVAWSGP